MSEYSEKLKARAEYAREMDHVHRRQWRRAMYRIAAKTAAVVVGVTVISQALAQTPESKTEESD